MQLLFITLHLCSFSKLNADRISGEGTRIMMKWLDKRRSVKRIRNSPYETALMGLPEELETCWRASAPQEYPGISTDSYFFIRAAEGLLNFFDSVGRGNGPYALPSEAADSVWHAWLRWDAANLERFSLQHFNRTVPHIDRVRLTGPALAHTLVAGRRAEGLMPHASFLPCVFRIDAELRMPQGHGYWLHRDRIDHVKLDQNGMPSQTACPHPELTMAALVEAGLVDKRFIPLPLRRRTEGSTETFSDVSSLLMVDVSGDSCSDGGADNCSDGGSSCGSSCDGGSCG